MSDVSAIVLAIEIVQVNITNSDGSRKNEKISVAEVEGLFIKSISQNCYTVTPDYLKGNLSY